MSAIKTFLASLTPPPFVNPPEYDGLEYRWRFFVFRPGMLRVELFLSLGILAYLAFFLYGKSHNARRVNRWLDAHLPLLTAQFTKPTNGGPTPDGYSDFFNFSTGRRNIASLHTVFTLRPRHDLAQYLFQLARTMVDLQVRYVDSLELDFTLGPAERDKGTTPLQHEFVWAVVAKDELRSVKRNRWDLTFTKTTENSSLPPTLSVMSEYADVTENIFKSTNILSILHNPEIQPYFRSLSVTDQPRERPNTGPLGATEREKHVILSLIAPPPSKAQVTLPLVSAVFSLIDALPKVSLRPETKAKLRKVREDLDQDLKEEAETERKGEVSQAVEDRKTAKKRAEEERVSKLSAAEQKKVLERDRKRSIRKQQGKVAIRK